MIKSIRLKKFKKFEDLALEVQPFTVLMGENNSGKTSLIQAVNFALLNFPKYDFIREDHARKIRVRQTGVQLTELDGINISDKRELFYRKASRGGATRGTLEVEIELTDELENKYRLGITLQFGAYNVKCKSTEAELAKSPRLHKKPPLYISGFVGLRPEEERAFPRVIEDRLHAGLVSGVIRNLVLDTREHNGEAFRRLSHRLKKDFDFHLGDVLFDPRKDLYVTALYDEIVKGKTLPLSFNASGSGYMQILQILAPIYMYCPGQCDIVLLDEPDAHLHPNLQATLATTLQEIQAELRIQIIVSTHSTPIIRATDPTNVVPISSKSAICKPLASSQEVERQIRSTIDTYSLGKSLISGKIVFVEDHDTSILETFDKKLGTRCLSGSNTVPVLAGRGKDDKVPFHIRDVLQKLVGADVEVHYIRDRDGLPQDIVDNMAGHAMTRGLNLHFFSLYEIENYLLCPELLRRALERKYPRAQAPTPERIQLKLEQALRDTILLGKYDYTGALEDAIHKSSATPGNEEYREFTNARSKAKKIRDLYEDASGLQQLRAVGMGKEALSQLLGWLNDDEKLNLSLRDILMAVEPADIPQELEQLLQKLRSKEAKPPVLPPRLQEAGPNDDTSPDQPNRAPSATLDLFGTRP